MGSFEMRIGGVRRAGAFALPVMLILSTLFLFSSAHAADEGNNPPPTLICQGWEVDTVRISVRDVDNDEVNYRLERSIDGAAFTEIATLSPNGAGNYGAYSDTGVDVTKQYRYRARGAHGDGSFTSYSPICSKRRIFETSNVANNGFRIFYGVEGTSDDCPAIDGNDVCLTNTTSGGNNVFVLLQQTALEGSADAYPRLGFDRDAATPGGGLDKIPVNVVWCDGGGCAGDSSLGLSPLLMETAFNLNTRSGDPIAYLVGEHEVFHFLQYKYGGIVDPANDWVYEGQARMSQDKVCIGATRATALCFDDIATGYAGYVGEINGYLSNTAQSLNKSSYGAALFWAYLAEKFGTSPAGDATEGGMNIISQFWKESAANPGRDGIAVVNSALATLGHSERFRDIWKDFAVANYAKNLTGTPVPAQYTYADMAETGGTYGNVAFKINQPLGLDESFVQLGNTLYPWAAHYYRFTPAADVPVLDIKVTQDTNVAVYYTVLGIKNNGIAYEYNIEGRNLSRTVLNNAFSEVIVMVAGMENLANYRIAINGTAPTLQVLSPTTASPARVGSIAAPEKFRIVAQLLAGDGTPMDGIDLSEFQFRVGDKDVPADQILTSAIIMDQQWFVVRAPAQDNPGIYDLRVSYGGISSLVVTNTLAVNYIPRTSADNMLIIDRSGSMAGPKLDAAKDASSLYVDSWTTGDMVGVVSFNETPVLDMGLADWTDSGANTRQQALDEIDDLTAGGGTNIGDSLMLGFTELQNDGEASHDWALVFLSDGAEEASDPTVTFSEAIQAIKSDPGKKPVIHAIAIGPNADGPKMQSAATSTGGTYQFVSAPTVVAAAEDGLSPAAVESPSVISNQRLDLDARYRYIATDVVGQQQFFTLVGPLNDGNGFADNVIIPMEGSVGAMVLSLSFDGGCGCSVSLRRPSGTILPIDTADGRHFIWRETNPPVGNWTLRIEVIVPSAAAEASPADASPAGAPTEFLPPYLVQSAVKSDVILDAAFPLPAEERVSGVPMPIVASFTDIGPILGATINATIVSPVGATYVVPLRDDGTHGDGEAGDGLYGNTFYQTGYSGSNSGAGSYNVTIIATGNSAIAGNVTRQKLMGFFIYSSGDTDGDGLPNEYETLHGGSPTGLDPTADPDHDGRTTFEEWQDGTDPLDSDSDNGGESDGSEHENGRDPFDPSDDTIEPTWTVAYPGVNKIFVQWVAREEYALVQIFRSDTPTGTYTLFDEDATGDGISIDSPVPNGQTRCYYAKAITPGGAQSAPSDPSCATASADPWAPSGGFLINGGASHTAEPDVMLTIFASDAVSPHGDPPGDADNLMVPPDSSATQVTQMRISNSGVMADVVWVPYATSAPWTLGQTSGLATVYMQFRDAVGNESLIVPNSILVGSAPPLENPLYAPLISNP